MFLILKKLQNWWWNENKTDFNIRRTYTLSLSNLNNSISNVHWFNLLHFYFDKNLKQYKFDVIF
jgi:hypothetical protein